MSNTNENTETKKAGPFAIIRDTYGGAQNLVRQECRRPASRRERARPRPRPARPVRPRPGTEQRNAEAARGGEAAGRNRKIRFPDDPERQAPHAPDAERPD